MHDEIGSEAQTRWLPLSLTLLDGEQMVLTADEECRFRHRGSRHQGFAYWILGQQLALGSGRIDEYIAVFAGEVESAIGGHRGGAEAVADLRQAARADFERRTNGESYVSPLGPEMERPLEIPDWVLQEVGG